jgi:hypothetical protein
MLQVQTLKPREREKKKVNHRQTTGNYSTCVAQSDRRCHDEPGKHQENWFFSVVSHYIHRPKITGWLPC